MTYARLLYLTTLHLVYDLSVFSCYLRQGVAFYKAVKEKVKKMSQALPRGDVANV